jgi:hypothetical protein
MRSLVEINRIRTVRAPQQELVTDPVSYLPPTVLSTPQRVVGRTGKVVLNSGEAVPIRYVAVEADWLVTSHAGLAYKRDPRYPAEAQPRDYGAELELQIAVESRATDLDPWQLLSNSVLPVDGPPIVRQDGIVVSGNGRTQSMRLAIMRGLYREVKEGIAERADCFGLDSRELGRMANPILVRMMDQDVTDSVELARYGIEMNRDPGQGMSACEQSIGFARLLTSSAVDQLAELVTSLPDGYSVREFMRLRAKDIAVVLSRGGIVDPRKRAEYFTPGGDLTEAAKDLVETALAGLTVTEIEVIRGASRATRDRLVRSGIEFMRMRSAGPQWDLAKYNNEAVRLITLAEDRAGYLRTLICPGDSSNESLVERLLHPDRFTNVAVELGFRESPKAHPAAEALARALELNPKDYVVAVGAYASKASRGWRTMYECHHPAVIFTQTIATRHDQNGKVADRIEVTEEDWKSDSAHSPAIAHLSVSYSD